MSRSFNGTLFWGNQAIEIYGDFEISLVTMQEIFLYPGIIKLPSLEGSDNANQW